MMMSLPSQVLSPDSTDMLVRILEAMPQAVVVMDEGVVPIQANERLLRLIGFDRETVGAWRANRVSMIDAILAPECRPVERARFNLLRQGRIDQYFSQVTLQDARGRRARIEAWVMRCFRNSDCYLVSLRGDAVRWENEPLALSDF